MTTAAEHCRIMYDKMLDMTWPALNGRTKVPEYNPGLDVFSSIPIFSGSSDIGEVCSALGESNPGVLKQARQEALRLGHSTLFFDACNKLGMTPTLDELQQGLVNAYKFRNIEGDEFHPETAAYAFTQAIQDIQEMPTIMIATFDPEAAMNTGYYQDPNA